MTQRHFFSNLHPLSLVIFATATVLAFVLLRNSRFNFHCYTQREATPTQNLARKCAATSCDFLRERLQSTFTLANQLRWIAPNTSKCFIMRKKKTIQRQSCCIFENKEFPAGNFPNSYICYVCMHACVCVCACVCVHACASCMCMFGQVFACVHISVCSHACMRVCL